jgi:adenine-specific DNA-methyltransferase
MPGYLIWLNARLYEMKRLLTKTGRVFVHCDWHASHYIKVELDKIFGYGNFCNEVVWGYGAGGLSKSNFPRKHDVLLSYSKGSSPYFNTAGSIMRVPYGDSTLNTHYKNVDEHGRRYRVQRKAGKEYVTYADEGKLVTDVWTDIGGQEATSPISPESIGYPTQKPERILDRVITSSCPEAGVVADFFCGGGTTAAVAQRLGRRWIACDQSRVAVAITADRLTRQVEEQTGKLFPVPDFTVEHWGVYEARRLADAPPDQFRAFVLRAFGAVTEEHEEGIHGYKGAIPVWVGEPESEESRDGNGRAGFRQCHAQDATLQAG